MPALSPEMKIRTEWRADLSFGRLLEYGVR